MNAIGWTRDHWRLVGGISLVGAAFVAGFAAHRPASRVVTVTEYRDRVVEKQVVVEKPVVQYRDRVITRLVEKPDGTKIETHVDEHSGKETGEKVTTTDTARTSESKSTVTVAPEGRWAVRVLAGADTRGGVVAGAGAEYRILGPLTAGAWVTVPVAGNAGVAAGLSLGLRL